jgi:hypothetical protein
VGGFLFFCGLGILGWIAAFWKLSKHYAPNNACRSSSSPRRLVLAAVALILMPIWLGPVVLLVEKIYVAIAFRH